MSKAIQSDPSLRGLFHWIWGHTPRCSILRLMAPSGRYVDIWECRK